MGEDKRKHPNAQMGWAWYNMGALIGVETRRNAAIRAVEEHTMQPWDEVKGYMEIHKVVVMKATSKK